MAFVQRQNGILMNSKYTGRYRFFTGRSEESNVDDSSPPYVVPVTVSILASQSLFLGELYSPASTLIIPFYKVDVPYGYIFIIFMQAVTALLVKWAYTPSPLYRPLLGNYQSFPDFEALKKIPLIPQPQGNTRLNNASNQDNFPSGPLLPKGIAINLSFISPFSEPTNRAASLFSLELTLIKTNRGYIISLLTLIIYFVVKPFLRNKSNRN